VFEEFIDVSVSSIYAENVWNELYILSTGLDWLADYSL